MYVSSTDKHIEYHSTKEVDLLFHHGNPNAVNIKAEGNRAEKLICS